MTNTVQAIPIARLALVLLPVFVVLGLMRVWRLEVRDTMYAVGRMLLQLVAIGYFLAYLFQISHPGLLLGVLALMLLIASWIALHPLRERRRRHYGHALAAISVGGLSTLTVVIVGVLQLEPWYLARYVVPLAGMIFANSMNTISLAAERYEAEIAGGAEHDKARNTAYRAALIPLINSLLAVGLVSFPGMMTGQILAGVSPLIAARYQIMVMCMLLGSAGISAACYLHWTDKRRA